MIQGHLCNVFPSTSICKLSSILEVSYSDQNNSWSVNRKNCEHSKGYIILFLNFLKICLLVFLVKFEYGSYEEKI